MTYLLWTEKKRFPLYLLYFLSRLRCTLWFLPVVEEVGEIVEHVSGQQHLAGPAEGLEVGLRDVKDLAATAEQIDGEQDEIRHHARRTAVPDHDVAQQMNLQKKLGI